MIRERTTTERFNDIFKNIEDDREAFFKSECEKYEITRKAIEIARREVRAKRAK